MFEKKQSTRKKAVGRGEPSENRWTWGSVISTECGSDKTWLVRRKKLVGDWS